MPNESALKRLSTQVLPQDCQIYKHSTQCSLSASALEAVERFAWDLPTFRVDVIEQRALSDWISAQLEVRHESPQLIYLREGKVTGVLNHTAIRKALS